MTAANAMPYEAGRNPALPWGYWLTAVGEVDGWPPLLDEQGRQWNSVREAFWISRLSMGPIARTQDMHAELEFLLAVLAAIDARTIRVEEKAVDLFGSWDRSRFYAAWLHGQKLVAPVPGSGLQTTLSPEGFAVLLMLASTRSPTDAPLPVGLPTLRSYHGLDPAADFEVRQRAMAARELAADQLQYRFVRENIVTAPGIVLVGDALGPNVPLRRKLWSMTLLDDYARDRMYLWLLERVDRWQPWGEMAYRRGARALSEHLTQVRFADEPIDIG